MYVLQFPLTNIMLIWSWPIKKNIIITTLIIIEFFLEIIIIFWHI
jgi:hypothetical protein